MPTVPLRTGTVSNVDLPNVRYSSNATAESFGGAGAENLGRLAGAVNQFGQTAQAIGIDKQNEINRSMVRDALNDSQAQAREYLTKNIYTKQGQEALNVMPEVQKQFDAIRQSKNDGFQNDVQRQMFNQHFSEIHNEHVASIQSFQERERAQFEHTSIQAENFNAVEDAVLNRNNPQSIANAEMKIAQNSAYTARGMGPDAQKMEVAKGISVLHTNILNDIASNSPSAGLEYFKANESKFLPTERDRLRKTLEGGSDNEQARQVAIQMDALNLTPEEARARFDAMPNDKVAELAESKYNYRQAQKERQAKDQNAALIDGVWKDVRKNGRNAVIPDAIPTEEQIKIDKYLTDKEKGVPRVTDPNAYQELSDMAGNNPEQFRTVKLSDYFPRLDESATEHFINLQNDHKAGKTEPADRMRTIDAQIKDSVQGMKQFGTEAERNKSPDKSALYNQFYMSVDQKIRQKFPDRKDRTDDNINAIIKDMLTPVNVDVPWGFDKTYFKFEVQANPALKTDIPANIKGLPGTGYDPNRGEYYQDTADRRTYYDQSGKETGHRPRLK
jgi:hypothetical protein